MRKSPVVLAAALTVLTAGCYKDFDFTGDAKADFVAIDTSGTWSDLSTLTTMQSGLATDIAVPGDWNADHNWDKAVVHPDGSWVTGTSVGTISFPKPAELPAYVGHFSLTMLPIPADYDGDGDADPAWYRESDATWFIQGRAPIQFGHGPTATPGAGTPITENDYDYPVPADYDGDGITDLSVFNPWTGSWRVRSSATNAVTDVDMSGNESSAMAVPGDYDGVGHAQRAVYGPNGWIIEGHASPDPFGSAAAGETGFPAVADFDGDGKDDLAFVGWTTGSWYVKGRGAVVTVDVGNGAWPIPSGYALNANLSRLNLLGFCFDTPDACTTA